MKLILLVISAVTLLSGCLKTRNETKETDQRQVIQQQVVSLQKTNADVGNRFGDLEEQFRNLNGRLDVVENQVEKNSSSTEAALRASQAQNLELNKKVVVLQEALTKMENDVSSLTSDLQTLRAEKVVANTNRSGTENSRASGKKDYYEIAQDFFNKKDWKQSILNFQKYRDENSKGTKFADSTYKIGVSFQELGMREEAKTFYDEVVAKFPKSEEARRAQIRLKGMKK